MAEHAHGAADARRTDPIFKATKVRDVMRRWFERVEPDTSVLEAARVMTVTGQQALPVVVDHDRLVRSSLVCCVG